MQGRLEKAEQFLGAAELIRASTVDQGDVGDSYVILCVHAGIAAADAICCAAVGEHAQGDDHQNAIALLKLVQPNGKSLANALAVLLGMKTRAGYSAYQVSSDDHKRAGRSARQLVEEAQLRARLT